MAMLLNYSDSKYIMLIFLNLFIVSSFSTDFSLF